MRNISKLISDLLLILATSAFLTGCIYNRDVSSRASRYTDYVIGQTYELKQPVFLHKFDRENKHEVPTLCALGTSGTSANVETFLADNSSNQQVVGLVRSGQKLEVFKIQENCAPNMGPFLHIHAKIVGGAFDQLVVDLMMISKDDVLRNQIWVDSSFLALSKD